MSFIPNKLHFIWVGTQLPRVNAQNMLKWMFANVLYEVFLWTESAQIESTAGTVANALGDYVLEGRVENIKIEQVPVGVIVHVDTPENIPYTMTIAAITSVPAIGGDATILFEELETMRNYGAASDILRLWILYEHGGVYLDFDVFPQQNVPLPLCIHAPREILFASTNRSFYALNNCIIAGGQRSSKLLSLAQIVTYNYSAYYEEEEEGSGVWAVGREALDMESELVLFREKVRQAEAGSAAEIYWKHKLSGVLSLPTVSRTGPLYIARWLFRYENVQPASEESLLYSFQYQTQYVFTICYDNSWMK
ncbi:MAG: hypothetical protein MI749_21015 [Desulfovibrionales bacterium]|nr:hypothetical protein [Desulfovibrionales bacterium]